MMRQPRHVRLINPRHEQRLLAQKTRGTMMSPLVNGQVAQEGDCQRRLFSNARPKSATWPVTWRFLADGPRSAFLRLRYRTLKSRKSQKNPPRQNQQQQPETKGQLLQTVWRPARHATNEANGTRCALRTNQRRLLRLGCLIKSKNS